jgi:hypothetical protein
MSQQLAEFRERFVGNLGGALFVVMPRVPRG